MRSRWGARAGTAGQVLQRAGDHLLIGVEAGVDRAHRDQRGQHRRAGTRGDQIAGRHLDAADAPGDRRAHLGVAEVELRRLQRRLRRAQVGLGLAQGIGALVELALRDGALLPQPLGAGMLAAQVRDPRLRSGGLRLRALHRRRVWRRIDGDQQVAGLDQRALTEVHRLHRAGGARTDVDALHGFEASREFVPGRDFALDDRRDGHGRRLRRRGRRRRLGLGAGQHEDRGRNSGQRDDRAQRGPQAPAGAERCSCHERSSGNQGGQESERRKRRKGSRRASAQGASARGSR
jgi:hypothetical protein